ncbi:MAG TPA: ABC transporter permease [Terriglobales bacterium]|nr:ABC transporter permease [Terriglobales bacterium]
MRVFAQDFRYALRQMRKNPGSAATSVLTLALGIGATTAIFSVVYGVLLRPLPYNDPSRIMAIFEVQPNGKWNRLADPNFDDFRDQSRSFETIAKYGASPVAVSGGSQPTNSIVAQVSLEFFNIFQVEPTRGRGLTASDDVKGATPVAVVSYGYWKQYLGASPDLSQLHLKIDNAIYSIVGVMPPRFQFPRDVALWVAAGREGENPSRTSHNFEAVGRLREGVTPAQANAEISTIGRRIFESSTEKGDYLLKDATVVPLRDAMTRETRPALLILLGAVGFLLLVACANVANLRLAQASVRERELAIRTALGAARARLIRQFITEAFVLSLVAGFLGVLAAFFGVDGLLALAPKSFPRLNEVSLNIPVLVFAFLLCSFLAVGLGIFTAVRATAGNVREALVSRGHGQTGSQSTQRIGRGIVAAQIAITVALVVGAGLLGRSLMKVLEVDPGFRVDKIITMGISLPMLEWNDQKGKLEQALFFRNLVDRLKTIPGVRNVGAATGLPMAGGLGNGEFRLMRPDEQPRTPPDLPSLGRLFDQLFRDKERIGTADYCAATEGYFETLGIPLLKGRMFADSDGPDMPHVAVVSESLARERWPGQNPIGHTIEFGNMDGDLRLLTIIGIVADVHEYGLDQPPRPTVYGDLFQRPLPFVTLTMLSYSDPSTITSAARSILHDMNPEIPPKFGSFSHVYAESLGSRRFNLILVAMFGAVALILAMAGVFGVMAYSVSRRTREIGVRVALGARSQDVLTMVLGQGLRTVLIGLVIGLAGSFALTRTIRSLLFGVTPTDPLTFCAVVLLLVTVALLACYIPARRAAKIDPIVALRYE